MCVKGAMPTVWKRIVFSVGSILSIGSVVLLVVALSTERWITATILCQTGVDLVNASNPELEQFTGDMYYGLFQGSKTRKCGLGSRRFRIYSEDSFILFEQLPATKTLTELVKLADHHCQTVERKRTLNYRQTQGIGACSKSSLEGAILRHQLLCVLSEILW